MAYLLCRFSENQVLGTHGVVERYDATNKQAQANASALQSVLNQIVADAPSDAKIPTNDQETATTAQQPLLILTAADVESRYGSILSRYAIGNTNADAFVMAILRSCEARASAT